MHQHVRLGSAYRSYLVDDLHFLDPALNPAQLLIKCTSVERTFRSATSFLHGLYAPASPTEILDISSGTPNHDFFRPESSVCRERTLSYAKYQTTPAYLKSLNDTISILKTIKSLSISEWDLSEASRVCNWIMASFCNDQMMQTDVNETHFEACMAFGAEKQFGPWLMDNESRAIAFSFGMREVLDILEHRAAKFVLISAHDSTVSAYLSLLGFRGDDCPPLASHLCLEVWGRDGEEFVRFAYNGEVVKLERFGGSELVSLGRFVTEIKAVVAPYCTDFPA
jgi:acid phosphatase